MRIKHWKLSLASRLQSFFSLALETVEHRANYGLVIVENIAEVQLAKQNYLCLMHLSKYQIDFLRVVEESRYGPLPLWIVMVYLP